MRDVPGCLGLAGAHAQWDSTVRPSGKRWAVPPAASGGATRVDRGQARQPTRMVLAAPSGLERAVPRAVAPAGRPVVVVPPRQVRDWARATGQLAPTEAGAARARAHWADGSRPPPRPLPDAPTQERRALLGRCQPWLGRRTAAPHRLAGTRAPHAGYGGPDAGAPGGDGHAGRRPRDAAAGQPAVAGPRRPGAACPGPGPRGCRPVAAGPPRVGAAPPAAERGRGRRGAPQWRQGDPPRAAPALGRARAGAPRVIHGPAGGHTLQAAEQSFFRAAPHRGARHKSRPDRV
jgi:hypothetical protein